MLDAILNPDFNADAAVQTRAAALYARVARLSAQSAPSPSASSCREGVAVRGKIPVRRFLQRI